MSDETTLGAAQDAPPTSQPTQPGRVEDLPEWAQKLIRETRAEAAERRVQLQQLSAAQQQKLIEEGNFKALAEQRAAELAALTPIKERAETLEKMIRESNSSRIATVREDMRALIPVDYPPERLAGWLDANMTRLTTPNAPNIDAGAGAGNGGKTLPSLTPQEVEIARLAGMKPEQYAQQKAKQAAQKP